MVWIFSLYLQYGIGQWGAIKMAIRRSQQFRFDYFFRSLPVEVIGRRCETLMKAALKEVEFLEKKIREDMGLPVEAQEGTSLPPIQLPKFKDIQRSIRAKKMAEREKEKKTLEDKVENLEHQIEEIQNRLKQLSKDPENLSRNGDPFTKQESSHVVPVSPPAAPVEEGNIFDETKGAIGPEGDYVEFPHYDGSDPPKEPRKAFAQFCQRTRKSVKNSLAPEDRRNKEKVNGILKARFTALSDDERQVYRGWAAWDKLRHARDLQIFENAQQGDVQNDTIDQHNHIPKKRNAPTSLAPVPKKKKL